MTDPQKTDNEWWIAYAFASVVTVIIILVIPVPFLCWILDGPKGPMNFGNYFSALDAAISGFAFAGLLAAVLLQRVDLSLQRIELHETRKELARTADAQTELTKIQGQQMRLQDRLTSLEEAREKAEHSRCMPDFTVRVYEGSNVPPGSIQVNLTNSGGVAKCVEFTLSNSQWVVHNTVKNFSGTVKNQTNYMIEIACPTVFVSGTLRFCNERGRDYSLPFTLREKNESQPPVWELNFEYDRLL